MTALAPFRVHAAPRPARAPRVDHGMRRASHDPFSAGTHLVAPQLRKGQRPATGPLRVLAYVDRYPPFVNAGAEWMLHHLLRSSVRAGHQVDVATAVPSGPHDVEGVRVWPVAALGELAKGADVAVGHLLWTRQVVELADHHRLPLLYLVHNDSQVRYWGLSPLNVTMLVHNSRWIAAAHPLWRGPAATVRPPVLVEDYDVDRAGAEYVTLVNPIPEKGAATFYALAKARRTHRFLAVEGAYGRQQRQPVGNVEHQDQTGDMRHDVYRRTRVLLNPSSYESWGRVACEALCSGIPVLAHPTPGLREALGRGAQFIDRDDHDAYVRALDDLDDPDTYEHWSARARARAAELDRQARRDLHTWDQLLRVAAAAPRDRSTS